MYKLNSTLEPRPRSLIAEIDSLIWDAIGDNEGCPQHYGNALYDCLCSVPVPALKDALGRATDSSATPPAVPLDVEWLRILSRELAWASEETRQRLVVLGESRDHSPDEGWERLTEFQRDQWIRRAAAILARLTDRRPTDG